MKAYQIVVYCSLVWLGIPPSVAQVDTTCQNFEVATVYCNQPPNQGCNSTAKLEGVIAGSLGSGCNHPLPVPG